MRIKLYDGSTHHVFNREPSLTPPDYYDDYERYDESAEMHYQHNNCVTCQNWNQKKSLCKYIGAKDWNCDLRGEL